MVNILNDFKKNNIDILKEHINEMYSKKPVYSNYFNQNISSDDIFYKADNSLIIIKVNDNYNRVYILSNDSNEIVHMLKSLKGINIVNIPSKNDISDWTKIMVAANFKLFAVYERFFNIKIKKYCNTDTIIYAKPNQEKEIYNLFHKTSFFSPYTDYLPSRLELMQLIKQNQIIVNVHEGIVTGAFIFSEEGLKFYLRAWYDENNSGIKLLWEVYSIMYDKGLKYAYFWINSENNNVKSIHKYLGAKPDGLKDYTFIKQ